MHGWSMIWRDSKRAKGGYGVVEMISEKKSLSLLKTTAVPRSSRRLLAAAAAAAAAAETAAAAAALGGSRSSRFPAGADAGDIHS